MDFLTFEKLAEIIERNQIPKSVRLMSDSGWKCDPTEMTIMYYSKKENVIVFSQDAGDGAHCTVCHKQYYDKPDWVILKQK